MTRSDSGAPDSSGRLALAEGELAPFFEAARAAAPTPTPAFLDAILADAARVAAERLPSGRAAPARRRAPRVDLFEWLRPIGGPIGAAALAACVALGFVAGQVGTGAAILDGVLVTDDLGFDPAAETATLLLDLGGAEG